MSWTRSILIGSIVIAIITITLIGTIVIAIMAITIEPIKIKVDAQSLFMRLQPYREYLHSLDILPQL